MTNQSFTDFKVKKKKLEADIVKLCNDFSVEFGVKVESIYIKDHVYALGDEAQRILSLKVETEV